MNLVRLALRSILSRKIVLILSLLCFSLSIFLILFVNRVYESTRLGFSNTISDVHLMVGPRTGAYDLLLSSLFGIGIPQGTIPFSELETLRGSPTVDWAIPLAFGDSFEGYRVVGTDESYFKHYRFGKSQALTFSFGEYSPDPFALVLGADVARILGLEIGAQIELVHGFDAGAPEYATHSDNPFKVSGILQSTGTPVDRQIYASLEGLRAIHSDFGIGEEMVGYTLNAILVRLSKISGILELQRNLATQKDPPLTVIFPETSLQELWRVLGVVEWAFLIFVWTGFFVSLGIWMSQIFLSMELRERELAIFRSLGMQWKHYCVIVQLEFLAMALMAIGVGMALFYGLGFVMKDWLQSEFGLLLDVSWLSVKEWRSLLLLLVAFSIFGWIPMVLAWRKSLAAGLLPRL